LHEDDVKDAAAEFVKLAPTIIRLNAMTVSHLLFSVRPKDKSGTAGGRQIPIPYIATDRIKTIVSSAAAEAEAEAKSYCNQYRSKVHSICGIASSESYTRE
jgi:hypothetical protein